MISTHGEVIALVEAHRDRRKIEYFDGVEWSDLAPKGRGLHSLLHSIRFLRCRVAPTQPEQPKPTTHHLHITVEVK